MRALACFVCAWCFVAAHAAAPVPAPAVPPKGQATPIAPPAASATDPLPPLASDVYFTQVIEFGHTLSGSGKLLAYVRFELGNYALFVADIDTRTIVKRIPLGGAIPYGVHWFGESRLLFSNAKGVFTVNTDGSDLRQIMSMFGSSSSGAKRGAYEPPRLWRIESTRLSDPDTILVRGTNATHRQNVYRLDVFTGAQELLLDGEDLDVVEWVLSPRGNSGMALRRGNRNRVLHFRYIDGKLRPFVAPTVALDYDGRSLLNRRAFVLTRTDHGDFVLLGENSASDRYRLLRLDLRDNALTTLVEDAEYDVGTPSEPPELLVDRASGLLAGVRYLARTERTVWFDAAMAKLQSELDVLYPNRINRIVDWSLDRSRVLVFGHAPNFGGVYFVYVPGEQRTIRHTALYPSLPETRLTAPEFVQYTARDGTSIPALLYMPRGPGPHPQVVLPHGGPFARDDATFDPFAQFLVDRGYLVLKPQFRGSIGHGRAHLLAGKGELSGLMVDDIADGARAMIERGQADARRTYILGASYGGFAAITALLRYPDLFAAAASFAAPTDLEALIEEFEEKGNEFAYDLWTEMMRSEHRDEARLPSIVSRARDIARPLLVVHGNRDTVVPVTHAERVRDAAKSNRNVTVSLLADEGHDLVLRANRVFFMEKAIALFAAASLPASPTADTTGR